MKGPAAKAVDPLERAGKNVKNWLKESDEDAESDASHILAGLLS